MDKKLTISLDQQVIERAKRYAKKHNTSLSMLIENYFTTLTSGEQSENEIRITPLVESLCGVTELPPDYNFKESRALYLHNKHR